MATKTKKADGTKKLYKPLTQISHDGEGYGPGSDNPDVIELTDSQAAPLLADKAVEPLEAAAAK